MLEPAVTKVLRTAAEFCHSCSGQPGEFLRLFAYVDELKASGTWSDEELKSLKSVASAAICDHVFNRYAARKTGNN
jgi:hypothetical protein